MKTAVITGVAGQDGSYLAELLLAKDYRVIGTSRNPAQATELLLPSLVRRIEVIGWDACDEGKLSEVLLRFQPTEFYNLAAISSGSGMFDVPVEVGNVNGLAVVRILEAIRRTSPMTRFCQASSSEIFGAAAESPQSEATPIRSRNPYGAAKAFADTMVRVYRCRHRLFACSAILFNHESPRRGLGFVTRKVTRGAATVKLGRAKEIGLGNLDSTRDWGFAGDYVRAMWLMLQQSEAGDYVVATGVQHSVRDLCKQAFGYLGLDYRDHVRVEASEYRPTEAMPLIGNSTKAKRDLGWRPLVDFDRLVHMMVDADLELLRNAELTDRQGKRDVQTN